ncbi:MAG: hypothetical protein ACREXK_10900 [Gammaproteobacteria bacterium]
MSWKSEFGLAQRLHATSVPLVICGPLLRHVTPKRVCVFVALKYPREVTLNVFQGTDRPRALILEGSMHTVPLGNYLHVAVVQASARAGRPDATGQRADLHL